MGVQHDSVPQSLKQLDRWVEWHSGVVDGGKPTKIPNGSVADSKNWRSWQQVEHVPRTALGGIGFTFAGGVVRKDGARLIALDLDACVDPLTDRVERWALDVIDAHANSWCERSPSGTGLRQFVWVLRPPQGLHRYTVRVAADAPPGITKAPQLQVFGVTDAATYVTVTGERYAGAREVLDVPDLDWLLDVYGLGRADSQEPELPEGDAPPLDEIEQELRKDELADMLLDGVWTGFGSPSDAYHVLVQMVLRAANNDGTAALMFLLQRTAWGRGEVEGSADPAKYAKESWVRRDIARAAVKAPASPPASEVFDIWPEGSDAGLEPPPPPSRTVSHEEFLAARAEQQFLVYGLLPRVGVAQVFGAPASGKTPFAMSLALRVAGKHATFFGRDIERHGSVLYLVGEDANGLRWRAFAEQQALGIEAARVRWSKLPARLSDPSDVKAWLAEATATCPDLALIVVDTQIANMGGGDENSTEDMATLFRAFEALALQLQCLVLSVHHTGLGNPDRGRGSSVQIGALDAALQVTRDGATVTFTTKKAKNWEEPEPLVGQLVPRTVGADSKGRPITAITLLDVAPAPEEVFGQVRAGLAPAQAALLEVLRGLAGEPVSMRTLGEAAGRDGTGRGLRADLQHLIDQKLVEARKGTVGSKRGEVVYTLTEKGQGVSGFGDVWELLS